MILSVKIRSIRRSPSSPWEDKPEDLEKFRELCKEAEELFKIKREEYSRKDGKS
jgi:hypothetical protein